MSTYPVVIEQKGSRCMLCSCDWYILCDKNAPIANGCANPECENFLPETHGILSQDADEDLALCDEEPDIPPIL